MNNVAKHELAVLIVDDDAGARALHARFVADVPGFTPVAAVGTGEAAIERCAEGDIDLVLLDMRLPGISGVEVLYRMRTLGVNSPDVLVISSSQDRVTVRQALAAHVAGYLVKPFTAEALRARLEKYRAELPAERVPMREIGLGQGDIDRLFRTGTQRAGDAERTQGPDLLGELPKGIARVTLERVLEALSHGNAVSIATVAEASGLSQPTARRYLDYLVDSGVIDLAHRYGKRGRPEVLYRLVPQ